MLQNLIFTLDLLLCSKLMQKYRITFICGYYRGKTASNEQRTNGQRMTHTITVLYKAFRSVVVVC